MPEFSPWIAVIDDDPSVLKALRRLLQIRPFHVKTYTSARDFLATLPDGLPECLLLDLQMPEMTGLELLQHLKSADIRIPTIIITAHDEVGVRESCESYGVIAFLAKPVQSMALFAAIDAAGRAAKISRSRAT